MCVVFNAADLLASEPDVMWQAMPLKTDDPMQFYTDMRKLGQGASGTVFVGTDVRTGEVRLFLLTTSRTSLHTVSQAPLSCVLLRPRIKNKNNHTNNSINSGSTHTTAYIGVDERTYCTI